MPKSRVANSRHRFPNAVHRDDQAPCYFLHIPKTTCSKFLALLTSLFLESELWRPREYRAWESLLNLKPDDLASFQVLSGHFGANFHRFYHAPLRYLTFLRDPIARAVAHYEHVLHNQSHYLHLIAKELGSFGAYLNDERTRPTVVNFQLRCLGATLDPLELAKSLTADQLKSHELERRLDTMPLKQSAEALLRKASARLEQMCFVGLTEQSDEGLRLLCELFGWPAAPSSGLGTADIPLTSAEGVSRADLRQLKRLNEADLDLYQLAKVRFDRDLARSRFVYPRLHAFVSYAQNAEDVLLHRVLGSVSKGTYIDVGASDPAGDSVTKAFYDRGWRGINIEPVRSLYERLVAQRPEDVNIHAAVGSAESKRTLYEIPGTGLSTLNAKIARRHSKQGFEVRKSLVPIRTLRSILAEAPPKDIHFLKVDVEGWERQVLRGMDFASFRPWIVLVEATEPNTEIPSHRAWESLLLRQGYSFVFFDGLNRYYLARERKFLSEAFSRPVNCGDGYIRASEASAASALRDAHWNMRRVEQTVASHTTALLRERADARHQVAALTEAKSAADTYNKSLTDECDKLRVALNRLSEARETERVAAIRQVEALTHWATTADTHGKSLLGECEKLRAALKAANEAHDAERSEFSKQALALKEHAASAVGRSTALAEESEKLRAALKAANEAHDAVRSEFSGQVLALREHVASALGQSTALAEESEKLRAALKAANEAHDAERSEFSKQALALREHAASAVGRSTALAEESEKLRAALKAANEAHDAERSEFSKQALALREHAASAVGRSTALAEESEKLRAALKAANEAHDAERSEFSRQALSLREHAASAVGRSTALAEESEKLRAALKAANEVHQAEQFESSKQLLALREHATSAVNQSSSLAEECERLRAALKAANEAHDAERSEFSGQVLALKERVASAFDESAAFAEECKKLRTSLEAANEVHQAEQFESSKQLLALREHATSAVNQSSSLAEECERLRAALQAANEAHEAQRLESANQIRSLKECASLAIARSNALATESENLRDSLRAASDARESARSESTRQILSLQERTASANARADALLVERDTLQQASQARDSALQRLQNEREIADAAWSSERARLEAELRAASNQAQLADAESNRQMLFLEESVASAKARANALLVERDTLQQASQARDSALQRLQNERERLEADLRAASDRAQRAEANATAALREQNLSLGRWRAERSALGESLRTAEQSLADVQRHWAVRMLRSRRLATSRTSVTSPKRKIGVFTIASKNYLAYARVLLKSVAAVHPEYSLYLLLVDKVGGAFDPAGEAFDVVESDAIGIRHLVDMALRYDIMELNTAVKPFMFRWLLENTDLDSIIYIDPDVRVYSRFDVLQAVLATDYSMVLTPHITNPVEDGKNPNDHHMLQAGVFNLGFAAINRCDEARRFVEWWARRLETQACSDVARNLFTDQRWCDLAPCFLDRLHVLKRPGYNVAYWNLTEREITRENGAWYINGEPLVFFHFSGISVAQESVVSKHQNRFEWADLPAFKPLFDDYRRALIQEGWEHTRSWDYAYGRTSEGSPIPGIVRRLYREAYPYTQDLLGVNTGALLRDLCNGAAFSVPGDVNHITKLMEFIYRLRPDLQTAFNLATHDGRKAFCSWYASAAAREYSIPSEFIPERHEALQEPSALGPQAVTLADGGSALRFEDGASPETLALTADDDVATIHEIWTSLPIRVRRLLAPMMSCMLADAPGAKNPTPGYRIAERAPSEANYKEPARRIDALQKPAPLPPLLGDNRYISVLMHLIWSSRADLRKAFLLDTAEGQAAFVRWFQVAAPREYGITADLVEGNDSAKPMRAVATTTATRLGANLIGYVHTESGRGEDVRMSAAALSQTAVHFAVVNFNVAVASRQEAILDHGRLAAKNPFAANVFHVNADQMFVAYGHLGHNFFAGHYNIGYWAWELAKCPEEFRLAASMVDEIWAPSRFIQGAFAEGSDIPVEYMPLCVTLPEFKPLGRSYFGLPDRSYLFLYAFDFLSYLDRKNPTAAIRAFKKAFPDKRSNVSLVLKGMNCREDSPAWRNIMQLIDRDPRIFIINKTLKRPEVLALLDTSDCFVSLHRSEGFGRGPAEAMYLGKPVIATNYSGNTDFTLVDNSCLVDYALVPVQEGQYPFHHGQLWADANVDHAAWYMKKLYDDTAYARNLGAAAKAYIRGNFSQQVIGARYASRLKELALA
jgi:FkbM family methyltransferase